jgi:hypothetical protein
MLTEEEENRLREAQSRGAMHLDGQIPGWRNRITSPMSVDDYQRCVIVQVTGTSCFNAACAYLELEDGDEELLGFDIPAEYGGVMTPEQRARRGEWYAFLQSLWEEEIARGAMPPEAGRE